MKSSFTDPNGDCLYRITDRREQYAIIYELYMHRLCRVYLHMQHVRLCIYTCISGKALQTPPPIHGTLRKKYPKGSFGKLYPSRFLGKLAQYFIKTFTEMNTTAHIARVIAVQQDL